MYLRDIGWNDVDWIDTAQYGDQSSYEHGIEPSGSIKHWELLEWLHN
jgi:hypothetical protein